MSRVLFSFLVFLTSTNDLQTLLEALNTDAGTTFKSPRGKEAAITRLLAAKIDVNWRYVLLKLSDATYEPQDQEEVRMVDQLAHKLVCAEKFVVPPASEKVRSTDHLSISEIYCLLGRNTGRNNATIKLARSPELLRLAARTRKSLTPPCRR